jgi:hypothetical protein
MAGALVMLILAVWVSAIAVLVKVDRADNFLWIPTLLALAGVFGSMLPLLLDPNLAAVANGFILILFIASLAVLPKAPETIAMTRHVAR